MHYICLMEYRLHRLDGRTQHIVSATELTARDDLDALAEAEKICQANTVEIWQGARCVARVKQGNAPLNESDRTSL